MDNQNDRPNPNPSPITTPQPEPPISDPMQPASPWTPPVQTEPATLPPNPDPIQNPWPEPPAAPQNPNPTQTPTWTPPPQPPQPESYPPVSEPVPQPPVSPLDNPWGAPSQPPPLNGSQAPIQPSWMNTSTMTSPVETPVVPTESAPTDLSHLISGNNNASAESTIAPAETLVMPSALAANPEIPNLPAETHKGIPKWVIGLGTVLLLFVIAASAYFILGIGQPAKPTTSLPATTEVKPPVPAAVPTSQPAAEPAASGSANFGELGGSGTPQATSAADLLRQRQQGR